MTIKKTDAVSLPRVVKRNGDVVDFDTDRIFQAVKKATLDTKMNSEVAMTDEQINDCVKDIISYISSEHSRPAICVEDIQDIVEDTLIMNDYISTAKAYIRFRQSETTKREASKKLAETYNQIFFGDAQDSDLRRDNANINTDAPMGMMLKIGAEASKSFADNYVIPDKYVKADKENYIHIHDKDFSLICWNCCQLDIKKLFKGGFSTGHGFLREPNSIRSAAALACIAIN